MTLAFVVSSHGFGHAARAAAVISAVRARAPELRIDIFTTTPSWFFEQSLGADPQIRLHSTETDVGMVQATALDEDLAASLERLAAWYPLREDRVDELASRLRSVGAACVVADISPLGLAAAERAGLPSVLVENFTWDFIYRGYGVPALANIADRLAVGLPTPSLHLRTEPACGDATDALPPIARPCRHSREEVRQSLGIGADERMVLVTMGGVPWQFSDLSRPLETLADGVRLVIAGGAESRCDVGPAVLLPHRSDLYHPDMVAASDAVVAKLGYSTVAEVARCGGRLGYIPRPRFPESGELERWVREHLANLRLEAATLRNATWISRLEELLDQPRRPPVEDGAAIAAERILALLTHGLTIDRPPGAERSADRALL